MDVVTEEYRRHTIKSAQLSGKWAAKAFLRKTLVCEATGTSREDVVQQVKSKLDEQAALVDEQRDEDGAPPAEEYQRAFSVIEMNDNYRAMLRAHVNAPNYLITATELAEAAGYQGYEGANLHYGKLGFAVAEEIGFDPPKRPNGDPIWTCTIARGRDDDPEFPHTSMVDALMRTMDSGHFEWQMRPQVVAALKSLGY